MKIPPISIPHYPRILTISLPEYDVSCPFDHDALGDRLDQLIVEHFGEGDYADRAVGIQDHPELSCDELLERILAYGTDRYDSTRTSIFTDDFSDYQYDIHAGSFAIRNGDLQFESDGFQSYFGEMLYDFQHKAKLDRGYSVRINMILFYDRSTLLPPIQITNEKPWSIPFARYLFRFRPDVPNKGLVGVLIIE